MAQVSVSSHALSTPFAPVKSSKSVDGQMFDVQQFQTVRYEVPSLAAGQRHPDAGIARIFLDRPKTRNAQNGQLLYELNDAFNLAAADPNIKVIILSGEGPMFSSGHDLRDGGRLEDFAQVGTSCCFGAGGAEGHMNREEEIYLGFCRRWRNIPKATIAQVHGRVIAGGLMLCWPMDIIVASDDATFQDPVVGAGVNGVEWFVHGYELGPRKAKEFLFTADTWTAQEAHKLGMVNHVVPREQLHGFVQQMARKIAMKPLMGLKLAKESVNQALDMGGQQNAVNAAFSLHHVGHSHNMIKFGSLMDPGFAVNAGLSNVREKEKM